MTEMEILLKKKKTVGNTVARGRVDYNCALYYLSMVDLGFFFHL